MNSIKDQVSRALEIADTELKIASAASVAAPSFMDEALGIAPKNTPAAAAATPKTASAAPSMSSVLDDAEYGMKVAEALDRCIPMMKTSTESPVMAAPGPQVLKSELVNASAKAPVSVTNSLTPGEKSDGGGTVGETGKLQNTADDFAGLNTPEKSAAHDKRAAIAFIESKVAQAEMLQAVGQDAAAKTILAEARTLNAKLAADPSSPQPKIQGGMDSSFRLPTEISHTSQVPDNAGLIALTKSKAKDPTVRDAGEHTDEQPKLDPTIANVVGSSEGAKISSLEFLKRAAGEPGMLERAAMRRQSTAEDPTLSAIGGGINGASIGAGLGGMLGGSIHPKGAVIGGTLGALAGAGGGAYLGTREAQGARNARLRAAGQNPTGAAADAWEIAAAESQAQHESRGRQGAASGFGGAVLGGAAGAGLGALAGGRGGALAGGLLGAGLGGAGGAHLGVARADAERAARERRTAQDAEGKTASATSRLLAAAKNTPSGGSLKGMLATGTQASARGSAGKVTRQVGGAFGKMAEAEKDAGATSRLLAATKTLPHGESLKGMVSAGQQASARGSAGKVKRVLGSVAGGVS